jgi:superfamily II DNA or RNA helicase
VLSPPWQRAPRILSEQLAPLSEPLACLLRPGAEAPPALVAATSARALLDLAPLAAPEAAWPPWLAPHQIPAARRLVAIVRRYRGALLADAVGLGKSYVALAVALALGERFTLVVPAVLASQWRALLGQHHVEAAIVTHESLSRPTSTTLHNPPRPCLYVVDEAHCFRNPDTNRYRTLARLMVGAPVLLVTATPVHNRIADLFHLFHLFLRDHDLAALGVASLRGAARGALDAATLANVAARLVVARSRGQVQAYAAGPIALSFPDRGQGEILRAGPLPDDDLAGVIAEIRRLEPPGGAAALFRLVLLSRLASSLPAFRASMRRYEAFLDLARDAGLEGRALTRQEFQHWFPRADALDLQLALFPLVLERGPALPLERDRNVVRSLRTRGDGGPDLKAALLERLLAERPGKTIVFVQPRATARYLLRRLRGHRVAAVVGDSGLFGNEPATRAEVLAAFAPRAQAAPPPVSALETDVLIATDLLSEGLNLQDATRVVHYDLPWSPARLAQRVGRIDRLGSPHARVETVTFLPPEELERALAIEQRLATKLGVQTAGGAAQLESVAGREMAQGRLDWCDRLQRLYSGLATPAEGAVAAVRAPASAAVLVVRIGSLVEALVVTGDDARADPAEATRLLEQAAGAGAGADAVVLDRARLERAVQRAAALVRARLAALADVRWRAADRDRLSRRLIPWVLHAARRAARRGAAAELARLDALVSRLALGMTAGEELSLEQILARRTALTVRAVLAWHEGLEPLRGDVDPPGAELVAAVLFEPG